MKGQFYLIGFLILFSIFRYVVSLVDDATARLYSNALIQDKRELTINNKEVTLVVTDKGTFRIKYPESEMYKLIQVGCRYDLTVKQHFFYGDSFYVNDIGGWKGAEQKQRLGCE